jgi:hypothetical protein
MHQKYKFLRFNFKASESASQFLLWLRMERVMIGGFVRRSGREAEVRSAVIAVFIVSPQGLCDVGVDGDGADDECERNNSGKSKGTELLLGVVLPSVVVSECSSFFLPPLAILKTDPF